MVVIQHSLVSDRANHCVCPPLIVVSDNAGEHIPPANTYKDRFPRLTLTLWERASAWGATGQPKSIEGMSTDLD